MFSAIGPKPCCLVVKALLLLSEHKYQSRTSCNVIKLRVFKFIFYMRIKRRVHHYSPQCSLLVCAVINKNILEVFQTFHVYCGLIGLLGETISDQTVQLLWA